MNRVEIKSSGSPVGTVVEVDGRAVPHVREVAFRHAAGSVPRVEIDIAAHEFTAHGGAKAVWVIGGQEFTPADVEICRSRGAHAVADKLAAVMGLT